MPAKTLVQSAYENGVRNEALLEALRIIPRSDFLPASMQSHAHEDVALPIGEGQTISQPSLVAQMIELSHVKKTDKVLEIGTGSGYQTALLSRLAGRVFSLESNPLLAQTVKHRLETLRQQNLIRNNIVLRQGDGWLGWPQDIMFQAIIVSAAAIEVPKKLLDQLDPNQGIMVIPIGGQAQRQELVRMINNGGNIVKDTIGDVRFVPLI